MELKSSFRCAQAADSTDSTTLAGSDGDPRLRAGACEQGINYAHVAPRFVHGSKHADIPRNGFGECPRLQRAQMNGPEVSGFYAPATGDPDEHGQVQRRAEQHVNPDVAFFAEIVHMLVAVKLRGNGRTGCHVRNPRVLLAGFPR